ncbi:MAG: MFS transporter [Betaproteobacteria bacterium]|nr:MFS transporter [Betaproteobacteria bacterium]
MFSLLFGLPRTVWLLGLVSLFNDATGELIYPLVPLFLASVLLAGPRTLGLIEGVAEATASLLKLFSGILMDRSGHAKGWVAAGYALAAGSRPLFYLASSWPVVLLLRFTDRVGKGLRTSPRDALLANAVNENQRGLAFGLHRAMDNAGAVIGPLLAAYLLVHGMPLRQVFLWAIIPGLITLALVLGVKEQPAVLNRKATPFSWDVMSFPPVFKRYLLVVALFTLGNASNMFLLWRARDLGLAEYQVPLLWALTSAVAMILSTPLSALSDRLGRSRFLQVGWLVYGLFYLLLGIHGFKTVYLWPIFAAYGVFLAATEGVEKALVADLAPPNQTGTAYGWFNLTAGIMLLPASLVFGWLWQTVAVSVAFCFSAACALSAVVLLKFWVRLV